ncbi:MAG: UPF0182 family protein [Clostridiaceae bacterium]
MKKKVTITSLIIIIVLALIFIDSIVSFSVSIKWFSELGYLSVYFTKLLAVLKLMVPIFAVVYLVIYIYYKSIKKSVIKLKRAVEVDLNKTKRNKKIFIIVDVIISLFISISISTTYWYQILQFNNSVDFSKVDPLFGYDISFFVFKLPLIKSIYSLIMSLLVILIIFTIVLYLVITMKDKMSDSIQNFNRKEFKNGLTSFAGKQLAVVSFLILIFLSVGYFIKSLELVYSPRGVAYGASYTDVKVTFLFYKILIVLSLIAAVIVFIGIIRSKVKPILIAIASIIVVIVIEGVSSYVVQNAIVRSNEKTVEKPYIQNNIDYTRDAYNISDIDEINFNVEDNLTLDDLSKNQDTISNIKINSFEPALDFYNGVQVIRYYYTFNDIDVDRYTLDGKYTEVFVAPREIDQDALKENAGNWQNRHLVYTHGYGVVMSKVNSVTSQGQPDFVIDGIPPNNKTDLSLDNPRIYFGEKTNDYSVVNTDLPEIDYPKGDENQYNSYEGNAGIKMSFLNRVMFSIYYKNINFLLSKDINSESKILVTRNIVDRVKKIAPFLTYDSDPYIVVSNGQFYYILDAYTTTDKYPYSQPYGDINYVRNSIKVVVDAVNGDVNFYIVDENDPIVESYSKIFPDLFKTLDELPQDIQDHFRYPEGLFNVQCDVLTKYHMTDPGVFFNSEDLWQISQNEKAVDSVSDINDSSYFVMRLPGNESEEMVLVDYFNMKDRENMVSLLAARMDKGNYGKLVLYRFPTDKTIYGPLLFKKKINQDENISKDLSLWNKDGSEVIYGDTAIIPIENSLLYVEPLYLKSSGENSIPEMKRVILLYNDEIVSANSIDEALAQLFGSKEDNGNNKDVQENDSSQVLTQSKAEELKGLYEKALEAQKNGNWSSYGEYIDELGKLISELTEE